MKLVDIWQENRLPTLSFELFPGRNPQAAERLDKAIDRLAALNPDFVSVTFGAGGSTKEGSYQLIEQLKKNIGLNVLGYFAGYGLSPGEINNVLDSYQGLGLENILIVRGDKPHVKEGWEPHPESFLYASDLMAYVKPRYDFCFGCAGYPEGHIEAENRTVDLDYLKMKVDNGAERSLPGVWDKCAHPTRGNAGLQRQDDEKAGRPLWSNNHQGPTKWDRFSI
jgi:methylenetetrahydrofolate reductase (NADPH)